MNLRYILAILCCVAALSVFSQPLAHAQDGSAETGGASDTGGGGDKPPAESSTGGDCSNTSLLSFPPWYRGLTTGEGCSDIKSPTEVDGIGKFIFIIALNIIEMVLRLTGFAAVAFIIYGGYRYMISLGSPDGVVTAKKTIMNAVIGLIISVATVAIVNTIANGVLVGR